MIGGPTIGPILPDDESSARLAVARAAGHERVVCEVNIDPPNPGSDAFHAREGFQEIGRALNPDSGKTVRFFLRTLTAGDP